MGEKTWAGLQKTPGVIYRNRMHLRSFSVEMFRVNASQLMMFLQSNADPSEMMKGLDDLYTSHSIMREAARRLHNFLAGAMTLVDHTRVLVGEHYARTSVETTFKTGIEKNFTTNPMTRFLQDLRNYMVHRGMPPLGRAMRITPAPGEKPNQMNASVDWHLTKQDLLEWKGWKAEAKKYLAAAPSEIDITLLVQEYQNEILSFHDGLDRILEKHHKADVAEAILYEAELRSKLPS